MQVVREGHVGILTYLVETENSPGDATPLAPTAGPPPPSPTTVHSSPALPSGSVPAPDAALQPHLGSWALTRSRQHALPQDVHTSGRSPELPCSWPTCQQRLHLGCLVAAVPPSCQGRLTFTPPLCPSLLGSSGEGFGRRRTRGRVGPSNSDVARCTSLMRAAVRRHSSLMSTLANKPGSIVI